MAEHRMRLPRVEGSVELVQGEEGRIRLAGPRPRFFERLLAGRSPWEAVYLTQHISADAGVSHALAAVIAWERAAGLTLAENGRLLRELLHAVSLLHAHVRQFYQQALPDYLPPGSVAAYDGAFPALRHLRQGVSERPEGTWPRHRFEHPFSEAERRRLWEHSLLAVRTLGVLQRMMAVLGGKYPMVMSVVPGGINVRLGQADVLRLRGYLNEVREFLESALSEDARLLLARHSGLKQQGKGREDFLCAGTGEDESAFDVSLFPSGVYVEGRLERFASLATESIHAAYYRLATRQPGDGAAVVPAAEKPGAYSWIKAPRYRERVPEVGAFARLVITYLSGARMRNPQRVEEIESLIEAPLQQANTVGGRLLARLGEAAALVERCDILLDQLDPAQPTVQAEGDPFAASGEGIGHIEAPAGAVQHRMLLEGGRIAFYDIIGPSTWNGSPRDENGEPGSLELALNQGEHALDDAAQQRQLSRIVQSFAFSMSDAIH